MSKSAAVNSERFSVLVLSGRKPFRWQPLYQSIGHGALENNPQPNHIQVDCARRQVFFQAGLNKPIDVNALDLIKTQAADIDSVQRLRIVFSFSTVPGFLVP